MTRKQLRRERIMNQHGNETEEDLNEAEEYYAQLRAQGYTKTEAAKGAWPTQSCPKQYAWKAELRPRVAKRIQELKEERAEEAGLDVLEQVRRYTELYRLLKAQGKYASAAKMLERLDAIGGFDAPTKSVSLTAKIGGSASRNDPSIDTSQLTETQRDMERFARILNPSHTPKVLSSSVLPEIEIEVEGEFEEV